MVNPYSDIMIPSCEPGGWIAGNIKSWKEQSWFVFTKTCLNEGDNVVLFKIYQLGTGTFSKVNAKASGRGI